MGAFHYRFQQRSDVTWSVKVLAMWWAPWTQVERQTIKEIIKDLPWQQTSHPSQRSIGGPSGFSIMPHSMRNSPAYLPLKCNCGRTNHFRGFPWGHSEVTVRSWRHSEVMEVSVVVAQLWYHCGVISGVKKRHFCWKPALNTVKND